MVTVTLKVSNPVEDDVQIAFFGWTQWSQVTVGGNGDVRTLTSTRAKDFERITLDRLNSVPAWQLGNYAGPEWSDDDVFFQDSNAVGGDPKCAIRLCWTVDFTTSAIQELSFSLKLDPVREEEMHVCYRNSALALWSCSATGSATVACDCTDTRVTSILVDSKHNYPIRVHGTDPTLPLDVLVGSELHEAAVAPIIFGLGMQSAQLTPADPYNVQYFDGASQLKLDPPVKGVAPVLDLTHVVGGASLGAASNLTFETQKGHVLGFDGSWDICTMRQ
jgi:hypothetical protein